jgi:hypothetical protein
MPEGHQFLNVALAGVQSPRMSSKQGEGSEPWGEEVGHAHGLLPVMFFLRLIRKTERLCLGQVLHRVSPSPASGARPDFIPSTVHRYCVPNWFFW